MKNTVKLNEAQLKKIVAESVKKVLKEEGEGIEMMGSVYDEGYGKYGFLMDKLDEEGSKEIEFILNDVTRFSKNGTYTSEQVHVMLDRLKDSMIRSLDTRFW